MIRWHPGSGLLAAICFLFIIFSIFPITIETVNFLVIMLWSASLVVSTPVLYKSNSYHLADIPTSNV